ETSWASRAKASTSTSATGRRPDTSPCKAASSPSRTAMCWRRSPRAPPKREAWARAGGSGHQADSWGRRACLCKRSWADPIDGGLLPLAAERDLADRHGARDLLQSLPRRLAHEDDALAGSIGRVLLAERLEPGRHVGGVPQQAILHVRSIAEAA